MGFCCEVCCQTVNAPNCPCGARELVYKYQEAKYGYSSKDIQDEENKAVRKMLGEVLSSGYDRLVESLGKLLMSHSSVHSVI